VSDVVKDFSRTLLWRVGLRLPRVELEKEFRKLEVAARKQFSAEGWRGALHLERSLDLRYRGQGYELNVPATADVVVRFHEEHQRRYGYHHAGREIELVTVRLRAELRTPQPKLSRQPSLRSSGGRGVPRISRVERAPVLFQAKAVVTPILERGDLVPGQAIKGPAIITEYSATTVIPPGKRFWVDASENVLIELRATR